MKVAPDAGTATRTIWLLAVAGVALALCASASTAQSRPPRSPVDTQSKMQKSVDLQRQALQTLADPERAERLISGAYSELQAAHSDLIINAANMKFPDPLFDLNHRKLQQALALLQKARDAINTRNQSTPTSPIDTVRSSLEQALVLTNSVLATVF